MNDDKTAKAGAAPARPAAVQEDAASSALTTELKIIQIDDNTTATGSDEDALAAPTRESTVVGDPTRDTEPEVKVEVVDSDYLSFVTAEDFAPDGSPE